MPLDALMEIIYITNIYMRAYHRNKAVKIYALPKEINLSALRENLWLIRAKSKKGVL